MAEGDTRDHGPKYLNSPATPLFDKSRTLYLIDRAKAAIRKSGQAVIVEGYTDALMAHQAGFDNVVASLGTALTPGQVALLMRYAKDHELRRSRTTSTPPARAPAPSASRELNALIGEIQTSRDRHERGRRPTGAGRGSRRGASATRPTAGRRQSPTPSA